MVVMKLTISMQVLLYVLCLSQVLCATNRLSAWRWSSCGSVEPPQGHSVLDYTTGSRIRVDSNGGLRCSCGEEDSGSVIEIEKVNFSIVNGAGRIVARVQSILYPCLIATCSQQVVNDTNVLEMTNFTFIELLPEACNEIIELHQTSNTIEFTFKATQKLKESHIKQCKNLLFSQTHTIVNTSSNTNGLPSSGRTLSIKYRVPFDMDNCALKQSGTTNIVFHKKIQHRFAREGHVISKRDNNSPTFPKNYYNVEVVENSPLGTAVTVVQASDDDQGANGEITYSMEPSENLLSADYFQINSTTGEITITGAIDREMLPSHLFHVTATDGGGLSQTVIYTITVLDENDNSPVFTAGDHRTLTLDEDHQVYTDVLPLEVRDDDEGSNSEIFFTLENNTGNAFTIDTTAVSIGGAPQLRLVQELDYETINSYRLTVRARDGGTPSHNATFTVNVIVGDVLDNPPVFNSSEYNLMVLENTAIGTPVFTLNATTLDSPDIAVISYFILSGSTAVFSLGVNSGVLSVKHNDLDYEDKQRYTLSIRAQTSPNLQTFASVVIDIVNVNDNSPDFISPVYTSDIIEGTSRNHTVLTVRATDDDLGTYGMISYHIAGNNSNITTKFYLNSTTGDISTLAVLDYETQSVYSFDVVAKDGGNPARYDQVSVTIRVINVNDESPVFLTLTYNATVMENHAGALVAEVEAKDEDSPYLEYYIVFPGLPNPFSIVSGRIITREGLDREETAFYTLEVSASDGQLQSNENAFVYVTVEDVNDRSPHFESSYSVELSELLAVNSTVVAVEAYDEDEGTNSEITYTSNSLPGTFSLDPCSGVISLAEALDFEDDYYYSFLVWANDSGQIPQSSSAVVEVTVLDENDNSPEFVPGPRTGTVRENAAARTHVLQVSATDADSGSNADLEFEIIADDNAIQDFSVGTSGIIQTRHPLDREEMSSYHLIVEVRDRGSVSLSSTTEVEVQIEDEIDFPPSFGSVSYRKEIVSDTLASTSLVGVTATTRDDVSPSSILYGLSSGANRTLFRIDQRSGVISAAVDIRPPLHAGRYTFQVTAQHQHLSAAATVTIDIVKVPRPKPLTLYINTFTSLVSPSTILGTITLDRPHTEPVIFSLDSLNLDVHRYFSINSTTGEIAVSNSAHRGYYELSVIATSTLGVGRGVVHVYMHTVTNTTLENTVVVEFDSGSEINFVLETLETFAAALTEILPCSREQVVILGIQEARNGGLLVAFAIREVDLQSYIPQQMILDRLRASEGSPRLENIVSYGSDVCTSEPCPNYQRCSPVIHIHRFSSEQAYKVIQSSDRVHISHPFSTSFACHCPLGYDLDNLCSVQTDHCASLPCNFGAPCRNLHDDYVCECPPFTGGKNCSLVCPSPSCNPCFPDLCLHGSECIESPDLTSYSCESCPWPAEYSGLNCELTSVHIAPNGYMAFPSLGSVVETNISFRFATVSSDGTLMYSGRVSGTHDVLSVGVAQGQLQVTLSLGDTDEHVTMTTTSQRKLNDGEWHEVGIHLDGRLQELTVVVSHCSSSPSSLVGVAEKCILQGRIHTQKKSLDTNTLLYFGGVEPHLPLVSPVSETNFDGCLANLVINDRIIDLASPVRQYGTSVGCDPREKKCHEQSCLRGECMSVWNGTVCHCEEFPECNPASHSVSLSNGYLRLLLEEGVAVTIENFTLAFRTRLTHATLIEFGDIASIQLTEGSLVYFHNSFSTSLEFHKTFNDGLWHSIKVTTGTDMTEFSIDSGVVSSTTYRDMNVSEVTSITLGTSDTHSLDHFDGCLSDFSVNFQQINLASAVNDTLIQNFTTEIFHAVPGCRKGSECSNLTTVCPTHSVCENGWQTHTCVCEDGFMATEESVCVDPCDPNPCQNRGVCIPGNPPRCECRHGYRGPTCSQLESAPCHIGFHSPPNCRPCYCDLSGVLDGVCDDSGTCLCNPSLHIFTPPDDLSCQLCDCHPIGSTHQQCEPSTGECPCRPGVTGRRCDHCMDSYAGMDAEGCKEAVVVRGVYTLEGVSYRDEFGRRGSLELHHLIPALAEELKTTLERFALVGEQEITITSITNSSGEASVHYTVSSYSKYDLYPLPGDHAHIVSSVMQTVVRSGWVGQHKVDPASHLLLTDCSSCGEGSSCVVTLSTPQPFACESCPDDLTLDGVICRKIVNKTCTGLDVDRDGISDSCDNCPFVFNPSQVLSDCLPPGGVCHAALYSGVLWSSVPEDTTATAPCAAPEIGYAKRQCLPGGVWGRVDDRDCVSTRAQQFLVDAASLQDRQIIRIPQLHFALSGLISFLSSGGDGGMSGGDLCAVGRYLTEVVSVEVELSAPYHGPVSEDHQQLLEALSTATSHLLSPEYSGLWTSTAAQYTGFSLTHLPHTLEKTNVLFHIYRDSGVSRKNLEIKTVFNITGDFSGAVMYMNAANDNWSSVLFPLDLTKNLTLLYRMDFVVGSYPTLASLLPPPSPPPASPSSLPPPSSSLSNLTIVSAVLSVHVWIDGVANGNLPAPVVITLAHTRKVYVYSKETAKCVLWQNSGSVVGWSTEGCEVIGVNASHTICLCSRGSMAAALLPSSSLQPVKDEADFHPAVFTYVSLGVSCVLLLLANLALWIVRWSTGNMYITVYKNLVLSLLLTIAVFLMGVTRTESQTLCYGFSVILIFLIISSFFWMLMVGVVITRPLLRPPPKKASCIATFLVVTGLWTIPMLMCALSLGVMGIVSPNNAGDIGYPHYCLIAPERVLVLISPIALLMILIITALVVILVIMKRLKPKKVPHSPSHMTPGRIGAAKDRARRHLAVLIVTVSLSLISWGTALLAIYSHVYPDPTRPLLEITFAISHTVLSGFLFTILSLNRKVRAQLVFKYQSSPLFATTTGNGSLVRMLRDVRRRQGNSSPRQNTVVLPPHVHRGRRIEARNIVTRDDLETDSAVSMEGHSGAARTGHQYCRILTTSSNRPPRAAFTAGQQYSRTSHRNTTPQRQFVPSRAVPLPYESPSSASGEVARVTDAIADGERPWYHSAPMESHEQIVRCTPRAGSDNDESLRADPSGVSSASTDHTPSEEELHPRPTSGRGEARDEGRGEGTTSERRHEERGVRGKMGDGFCVQRETPERGGLREGQAICNSKQDEGVDWEEGRGGQDGGDEEELDSLQPRVPSTLPGADPMWYRRASGCEETGNMPTLPSNDAQKNLSPQKSRSVTWADQEPATLSEVLQNPRHSDGSYYSAVSSRNHQLDTAIATNRRRRSLEGSPGPKLTQELAGFPSVGRSSGELMSPPLSSLRSPPEGTSTAAMCPSLHGLRKSLSGGTPPPSSPVSHVPSSTSSQNSSGPPATRLPVRGVAVGQSPSKTTPSSHDCHCSDSSTHHNTDSQQRPLIMSFTTEGHNRDGPKILQSLV